MSKKKATQVDNSLKTVLSEPQNCLFNKTLPQRYKVLFYIFENKNIWLSIKKCNKI